MPYASVDEVPDYVEEGKRAQWREVWNSVYTRSLDEGDSKEKAEQSAFTQANGVVKKFLKFTPLFKVDATNQTVTGILTSETMDKVKEVCNYAKSKPYYEKWSQGFAKATGGQSLGNVREMHQLNAVGKLISINYDDTQKAITGTTKVVDPLCWKKCEEGVLTGYSHGGEYVEKYQKDGITHYVANPTEISLVDNPCNPDSYFTYVRADGVVEMRKFADPVPVLEGKDVEKTDVPAEVPTIEDVKEKTPDKTGEIGCTTKVDHTERLRKWLGAANEIVGKARGNPLEKGMRTVSALSDILLQLAWLKADVDNEQQAEGDSDSTLPKDLEDDLTSLAETLVNMVNEETKELVEAVSSSPSEAAMPLIGGSVFLCSVPESEIQKAVLTNDEETIIACGGVKLLKAWEEDPGPLTKATITIVKAAIEDDETQNVAEEHRNAAKWHDDKASWHSKKSAESLKADNHAGHEAHSWASQSHADAANAHRDAADKYNSEQYPDAQRVANDMSSEAARDSDRASRRAAAANPPATSKKDVSK